MPENPAIQKTRLSCGIDLAFRSAFVVAPDLPGFGASDVLPKPTFAGFADCIDELLSRLNVEERFIYLHDFGAAVGLQLAMRAPHVD